MQTHPLIEHCTSLRTSQVVERLATTWSVATLIPVDRFPRWLLVRTTTSASQVTQPSHTPARHSTYVAALVATYNANKRGA